MRLLTRARRSSSTPGARLSLRSWVALFLQERRRNRIAAAPPLPPFPIVTLSNGTYYGEQSWFDTAFDISVDLKTWGAASLEIWANLTWTGYELLQIVASGTVHYVHYQAAFGEATFMYKARYRNGDNVGSFSNEITIDIQI